jgi:hypothetical protein
MKTLRQNTGPQKLVNEIQLARVRLARAESKWELADEQAREARRRRKEAKQAARRAKKLARQAKQEFAAAKEALIEMEEKFAAAVERAARQRKLARARLAAARHSRNPGSADSFVRAKKLSHPKAADKAVRAPGKSSPAAGIPADSKPAVKRKETPACRPLSVRVKSATATAVPVVREEKPIIVPRDFESPPGVTAPLPESRSSPALPQLHSL